MKSNITQEEALEQLKAGFANAEEIIKDEDKIEKLLLRIENKLKVIPKIGDKLSHIPVFVSLIRSYVKKEYREIPIGSIIAVTSALIYFVSPIDLIPDFIPIAGYIDDGAVAVACFALVDSDIQEYIEWRDKNNKTIK